MTCACDAHLCEVHAIPAGLTSLPRALGAFPYWRQEVLVAIGKQVPLAQWRARDSGDLGIMLVEMMAYMADVTSFYDALIANESYLATARLPGAVRALTSLLGYLPRPAFAASAWLAAEGDGVRLIDLPALTAFRSGAFSQSAPQLFEIQSAAVVEPRVNRLNVDRIPATLLPASVTSLDVNASSLRAKAGDIVVLSTGTSLSATRIASAAPAILRIRRPITRLNFIAAITSPAGATFAGTRLLKPAARNGLWKLTPASSESAIVSATQLSLDSRIAIHPGDLVVIEGPGALAARRVTAVGEVNYTVLAGLTSSLKAPDGTVSTMDSPAIRTGTTRITVDQALPFAASDAAQIVVHHAMTDAATIHVPLKDTLEPGDPVHLPAFADAPRTAVTHLALEDAFTEAVVTTGRLDAIGRAAVIDGTSAWGKALTQPVVLRGNVFLATRGETVHGELLGLGDVSQPLLRFRLKKKPLTYLAAANSSGRATSLSIWVGGVRWSEVESFYGQPETAEVYIVRHDEKGETDIEFGGCARPPTGAHIVADYRFGAGAASPPAASVTQLARPVAGLRSVTNPLPAFGGADAEPAAEIKSRGPASALLLGRAVSLADIEAAAAARSGVHAAKAAWQWDAAGLRPMAVVRYIGDAQLAPALRAALRAMAEDDAPITVLPSQPQAMALAVEIVADERFVTNDVADAVGQALFAPVTLPGTGGLLRGERLGPDGVLFSSVIIKAIMDVPGVTALRSLVLNNASLPDVGVAPNSGSWFDFSSGGVRVNGRAAT
jgi:predicted phage baseplate assembly protein